MDEKSNRMFNFSFLLTEINLHELQKWKLHRIPITMRQKGGRPSVAAAHTVPIKITDVCTISLLFLLFIRKFTSKSSTGRLNPQILLIFFCSLGVLNHTYNQIYNWMILMSCKTKSINLLYCSKSCWTFFIPLYKCSDTVKKEDLHGFYFPKNDPM